MVFNLGVTLRTRCVPRGIAMRRYSSPTTHEDIRARLTSELKSAMKSKDTARSITIRSVLSEVYAADKTKPEAASSSTIIGIIRKAAQRRTDAAAEFEKAARADLAEKEKQELVLLQSFLPPLMSEAAVDQALYQVLADEKISSVDGDPRKVLGKVFKAFYSTIDKTSVDSDLVKRRAEFLLSAGSG